jgi:hypothetical protein
VSYNGEPTLSERNNITEAYTLYLKISLYSHKIDKIKDVVIEILYFQTHESTSRGVEPHMVFKIEHRRFICEFPHIQMCII